MKSKLKKEVLFIIFILFYIVCQETKIEIFSNAMLTAFDTVEQELDSNVDVVSSWQDKYQKENWEKSPGDYQKEYYTEKEKYYEWIKFRKKERKHTNKLYCMEDLLPELNKPQTWKEFYLLKDIPNGFYLEEDMVKKDEGWTVIYSFLSSDNDKKKIIFAQSNDELYYDKYFLNSKHSDNSKYLFEESGDYNLVYWMEGDIVLLIKTNLEKEIMMNMVRSVVPYSEVKLNYEF